MEGPGEGAPGQEDMVYLQASSRHSWKVPQKMAREIAPTSDSVTEPMPVHIAPSPFSNGSCDNSHCTLSMQ